MAHDWSVVAVSGQIFGFKEHCAGKLVDGDDEKIDKKSE